MDDYTDISDMKKLNIEKRYDRIFGYELTFKTEYSTYKNKFNSHKKKQNKFVITGMKQNNSVKNRLKNKLLFKKKFSKNIICKRLYLIKILKKH